MKQSRKHLAAPTPVSAARGAALVLATAALGLLGLHCSSDTGDTNGTAGTSAFSGAGGGAGAAQGGTSSGAPTGGVATGGTVAGGGAFGSAGAAVGGAGAGGVAGSVAGGTAGVGGAGAGNGGMSGAGGAAGGVTFAQVRDLLAMSCKGSKCHDADSTQMDWTTADGLYMRLTSPIPNDIPHCVGNTAIVPGDAAGSLLVQAINGRPTCNKAGGGMETIGRMPDDCPTDRACLTPDQIKLITDWVTAGAPM